MASDRQRDAATLLARLHDELAALSLAERWQPTPDPEANRLLADNPFAFLLAVIADYGIPAERAWLLPFRLRAKLGHLDSGRIAGMEKQELEAIIRTIPSGHRFPGEVAKFFIAASKRVLNQYEGDAAGIWKDRTAHDAYLHLCAFLGVAQKKASMAVNILCRDLGWLTPKPIELKAIDVSYDVHVRRVFLRLGLADSDTMDEILEAARELSPDYPGKLDLGAWYVGRTWCRPTHPDCGSCRLVQACQKRLGQVLAP